ncbi:hypothetical protein PT974_06718 [Cladobotryum mycophilum]|uniref:Uncharacterized protein n=1 Tax=Cladobotryum mycophilum TaxID=491253 RepID=A0ABR0SMI8_9HYPO
MPRRSTSTVTIRTSNSMKRKRGKEDRMASARRRKKSKSGRVDSNRGRVRESTCLADPDVTLEQPTDADFFGFSALPPRYLLRLQSASTEASTSDAPSGNGDARIVGGPLQARSPWVPAFNDDSQELAIVRHNVLEERTGHKMSSMSVSQRVIRPSSEVPPSPPQESSLSSSEPYEPLIISKQESKQEPKQKPEPANFMSIPLEIRDKIYRELLLARKAIQVHGNWTFVYKRNKLALHPTILTLNKRIHNETSRILYGENTFLYLLRDAPSVVWDIDRLALSDTESIAGDEGESGSEWEGEGAVTNKRTLRRRNAKKPEYDINWKAYSHLFRNIAVEAEHNRYSEDTQASMANAINMFAGHPSRGRGAQAFSIRTLTVRITPQWDLPENPEDEGYFTFVNFFQQRSPVLQAIKAVECQFLRVDLLTRYMGRSRGAQAAGTDGAACRLIMDMRHLRIWRQLKSVSMKDDWWARDPVMLRHRQETLRQSMRAVDNLAEHIERQCHERDFERWTTTGEAVEIEDVPDWLDEDGPIWEDQDSVFWTNNNNNTSNDDAQDEVSDSSEAADESS